MKSLFIVNDFPPILGGQSRYYYNLCRSLPADKLIVLAPCKLGYQEIDNQQKFKIIRKAYVLSIPYLEKIVKIILPLFFAFFIIKKEEIKFVHCAHVLSTGIVGLLIKKILGKPYIIYTHAADILEFQKYQVLKYLLVIILNNAYRVITNSSYTRDELIKLNISEAKIILVYPRIEASIYSLEVNTTDIVRKYNLEGKKVILSLNRLVERKGNDRVIEALSLIKKEISDFVYLIVGDGPYRSKLEELVAKHNLQDYVLFIGEIDDDQVSKFYHLCDLFVMISRDIKEKGDVEGFGIVFLEANAAGKPVIGGKSGGIPDAVEDGVSGFLVDPEDVAVIAQAIIRILKDPVYGKKLGAQGKRRVLEKFDCHKRIAELDFLF